MLRASAHDTYVETLSNAADTLHLGLDDWTPQAMEAEYSRKTEKSIRKLHLGSCDAIIDITEENFFGPVKGLWLHPWTGEAGVTAHFKFLVCSIKYRNRKYPIAVRMLRIGPNIAEEIGELLASCRRAGLRLREVLLDRGFYSADVIREMREQEVFYLIFAPRNSLLKSMLDGAARSVNVEHEMTLRKDKTHTKIPTDIALVKNVHGQDWAFATNLDLQGYEIVQRYRLRWNIETDFRVQDEARAALLLPDCVPAPLGVERHSEVHVRIQEICRQAHGSALRGEGRGRLKSRPSVSAEERDRNSGGKEGDGESRACLGSGLLNEWHKSGFKRRRNAGYSERLK
ncbi:transposase [Candidatus Woesearchaeota archaeon]|nr:transposase [Candidatus Woesearchaeota archaeon]